MKIIYGLLILFNFYYLLSFLQQYHYHFSSLKMLIKRILFHKSNYLLLFLLFDIFFVEEIKWLVNLCIILIIGFYIILRIDRKLIVKLRITKRILRISFVSILLIGILSVIFFKYMVIFVILSPLIVYFSLMLLTPIEYLIQRYYLSKAKKKVLEIKPLVIGITGSSGKTSVKHYLKQMLEDRYTVFSTPKSYNTVNGIAKSINEEMSNTTEIAIIEYGASKKDDIKKSLEIIKPDISIITNVIPQHLETFKTMDNIIKEKALLTKYSKFHIGNLERKYEIEKQDVVNFGLSKLAYYHPKNIVYSSVGISFTLECENTQIKMQTKLLGEHNLLNILACIACLRYLKFDYKYIDKKVRKLKSVSSRLQRQEVNGKVILNDSFNSNIKGFTEAIQVAKLFPKDRVIITPGLVSGGEYLEEFNTELAKMISETFNEAFLVQSVVDHFYRKVFDEKLFNYHIVKDFSEAYNKVMSLKNVKTILIENDVGDIYKK